MDNREILKSMLNNKINDNHAAAELDLHNYLTAKMKEVTGISNSESSDDDNEDDLTNAD